MSNPDPKPTTLAMMRAAVSVLGVRQDPPAIGDPRLQIMNHIDKVVAGVHGPTVGSQVSHVVALIRDINGTHGARNVHDAFMDAALTEAYRTPANSPQAAAAHKQIATAEYEYWQAQNAESPSKGSGIAAAIPPSTRAALQQGIGNIADAAKGFQRNGYRSFDQFADVFHESAMTHPESAPTRQPTATEMTAVRHQQQRQQRQQRRV